MQTIITRVFKLPTEKASLIVTTWQWRSQGLPGWATCPPGAPKWGRKIWGKIRKLIEIWRNNVESGSLAHPGLWGWLRPCYVTTVYSRIWCCWHRGESITTVLPKIVLKTSYFGLILTFMEKQSEYLVIEDLYATYGMDYSHEILANFLK